MDTLTALGVATPVARCIVTVLRRRRRRPRQRPHTCRSPLPSSPGGEPPMGLHAGDQVSYHVFAEFFEAAVRAGHGNVLDC
eukprot:gene42442-65366_t